MRVSGPIGFLLLTWRVKPLWYTREQKAVRLNLALPTVREELDNKIKRLLSVLMYLSLCLTVLTPSALAEDWQTRPTWGTEGSGIGGNNGNDGD